MRRKVAAVYDRHLAGSRVVLSAVQPDREHVYQTYAIRVKERPRVMDALKAKGITTLIHYPIPLHCQEAYADAGYRRGDFPVAETLADEVLSLPMFPHMRDEQVIAVAEALKEAVG
jgi:dTDP-4-amino-4,6-dideoxygalactose transaminase